MPRFLVVIMTIRNDKNCVCEACGTESARLLGTRRVRTGRGGQIFADFPRSPSFSPISLIRALFLLCWSIGAVQSLSWSEARSPATAGPNGRALGHQNRPPHTLSRLNCLHSIGPGLT